MELEIKNSSVHGKGVFTKIFIPKGSILECDVIQTEANNHNRVYLFPFHGNTVCIHIGFGSFLNGSKNSNIKHLKVDYELKISYFEVLKDIHEGEELFLQYTIDKD